MGSQLNPDLVNLNGQIAVVTGGGRGIGRVIAQTLAAAGAGVAVLARSAGELAETVALIKASGGRSQAFPLDVTDADAVKGTLEQIERTFGPIDLLVNNAGVLGPIGPFAESDPAEWWRAMDINLRGPMLCSRYVLPGMMARGRGRIINVSSGGGAAAITYFSSYIAGKTALIRFTECIANELKPFGVSAFSISPGTVRTTMSEHSLYSPEGQKWFPWFRRIFDEGLDLPPEAPAQLVLKLASGKADVLSGRFLAPTDDLDAILDNVAVVERDKLYSLRVRAIPAVHPPAASAVATVRASAESAIGLSLHLERSIAAPIEQVFRAWIDSDSLAKWFLPPSGAEWITPPEVDATPGGRLGLKLISEGKVFHLHGAYREVASPKKLVFEWRWDADFPILDTSGDTIVTVEFFEQNEGTAISLTHDKLPNIAARDAHERGWNRCFDGITRLLAKS